MVLSGGTVYHAEDVAPNSIKTFTVTCPPGYFAMSGTASDADGATQLRSVPAGARSWTFSFGIPVTATRSSHVIVLVICSKPKPFLLGLPGKAKVKIKTATVKSKPVVIPPGETEETKLKCPAGSAPTGSGLSVSPGGAETKSVHPRAALLSNGQVARETTDMPVRGGFRFRIHNPATVAQRVRHSARCLRRKASWRRRHRRRRHRAHTRIVRQTFTEMAMPGSNLFDESSRRGEFPVGAGYSYGSKEDMIVFGHAFNGRRVLTPLINGEAEALAFRVYLLDSPGDLAALALP